MKLAGIATLTAACAVALAPLAAHAITFDVDTTGAPKWNRPQEDFSGLRGVSVEYITTPFYVDADDTYSFGSATVENGEWDNFILLYENDFDANDQLTNALIANDDNPSVGLSGFSFALTPNTQYYFITTGFNTGDFGIANNEIAATNAGNVILGNLPVTVPEASSLALAFPALAALGAALVARRRRE